MRSGRRSAAADHPGDRGPDCRNFLRVGFRLPLSDCVRGVGSGRLDLLFFRREPMADDRKAGAAIVRSFSCRRGGDGHRLLGLRPLGFDALELFLFEHCPGKRESIRHQSGVVVFARCEFESASSADFAVDGGNFGHLVAQSEAHRHLGDLLVLPGAQFGGSQRDSVSFSRGAGGDVLFHSWVRAAAR